MLTTRQLEEEGFAKSDLLVQEYCSSQDYANAALEQVRVTKPINCRTLEAQGLEHIPQKDLNKLDKFVTFIENILNINPQLKAKQDHNIIRDRDQGRHRGR